VPGHQDAALALRQQAAEIARVEAEVASDIRRRTTLRAQHLTQSAHLRERKPALLERLMRRGDMARVKPLEAAHRLSQLPGIRNGHVSLSSRYFVVIRFISGIE
jgi:hypothetical protein